MEKNLGGIISSFIMPCILIYSLFVLKRKNAEQAGMKVYGLPMKTIFIILYAGILLSFFFVFTVIMGWTKG